MTKSTILSKKTRLIAFLLATVVPTTVLAQPIDSWTFDESSGAIAHNSIPGRADGILTGGAGFVPGITCNAVYLPPFESVNFALPTGNLGTSDFTISFWLKTSGDGIGNLESTFAEVLGNRGAEGSADTPYINFRMRRVGSFLIEVTGYEASGYVIASTDESAGTVNDGNWHLVAAVRQGTQVELYIDGALRATGTAGDDTVADVQSLYGFAAGANANTFNFDLPFDGTIDGLKIYDRALSASELLTPSQKLANIISTIASYNLHSGIETALTAKVLGALANTGCGETAVAVGALQALINQANAQSGKKLTEAQANELIVLATEMISSLQ